MLECGLSRGDGMDEGARVQCDWAMMDWRLYKVGVRKGVPAWHCTIYQLDRQHSGRNQISYEHCIKCAQLARPSF